MYPLHRLQYSVTPRGHGSNMYCTICHTCNRTRTYTGYPDNICYDAYLGHTRNVLFRGHIQPSAYTITILDSLHATVQYNQRGRLAPSTILLPSIFHPCGVSSVAHTNLVCITDMIKMLQTTIGLRLAFEGRFYSTNRRYRTYRLLRSFTHSLRIPT